MRILYASPLVPPELVEACGGETGRLVPRAESVARSEAPVAGVCPWARAWAAEALADRGARALVLATTCDQMRRLADWLAPRAQVPVFLLNTPATWQTQAAARLYLSELKRLARFLGRLGGRPLEPDRLWEAIDRWDGRRAAEAAPTGGPPAAEAHRPAGSASAERGGQGAPTPPGGGARETCRSAAASAGPFRPAVPVALLGGPMMRGHEALFGYVAEAGGRVVLDGTETGERTRPAPFDRRRAGRDDPLLALLDAYFGALPMVFRRPDTALADYVARVPERTGARGIVVWRYVWCDHWAAFAPRVRPLAGAAVLDLVTEGDPPAMTHARDRIAAFLELLRREARPGLFPGPRKETSRR